MRKLIFFCTTALLSIGIVFTACSKRVVPTESSVIQPTATETNTWNPAFPTYTPTATATINTYVHASQPGWIDDCEDNEQTNDFNTAGPGINKGGYWITFDDNSLKNNGTSYVWPESQTWATRKGDTQPPFSMSSPGYPGSPYGTQYAVRVTGYVTKDTSTRPSGETTGGYLYGFIGFGTQLTPTAGQDHGCVEVDISSFTGVKFWCKGDGKEWMIKLSYTNQTNCDGNITWTASSYTADDEYHSLFIAPAAWSQCVIPFAAFTQYGWGTTATPNQGCSAGKAGTGPLLIGGSCPMSVVKRHMKQIQFQTTDQNTLYPATRELWIDDIQLY
jgi:hypothetical protein